MYSSDYNLAHKVMLKKGLFFLNFVFSILITVKNVQYKNLTMTGFELRNCVVRSDRSTN